MVRKKRKLSMLPMLPRQQIRAFLFNPPVLYLANESLRFFGANKIMEPKLIQVGLGENSGSYDFTRLGNNISVATRQICSRGI